MANSLARILAIPLGTVLERRLHGKSRPANSGKQLVVARSAGSRAFARYALRHSHANHPHRLHLASSNAAAAAISMLHDAQVLFVFDQALELWVSPLYAGHFTCSE